MTENRIVIATFDKSTKTQTRPLYQYDYGTVLQFEGIELPGVFEVDFANSMDLGQSKTVIGQNYAVDIPDEFLQSGEPVYAWIFLHDLETDGETVRRIVIPIKSRTERSLEEPDPVEQSVISQAIAALNNAVVRTGTDVSKASEYAASAEASADSAMEAMEESMRYSEDASGYAASAREHMINAAASADTARDCMLAADEFAESAEENASNAEIFADRAEQAAKDAGYMFFSIENGELIYHRTSNVLVDFYIDDGYLYVKGAG